MYLARKHQCTKKQVSRTEHFYKSSFYSLSSNIDLLKMTCKLTVCVTLEWNDYIDFSPSIVGELHPPWLSYPPSLSAPLLGFSRYISCSISSSVSFYLSSPPLFFSFHIATPSFSHFSNLSILFRAQLSLPSYLHVSRRVPLRLSLCWPWKSLHTADSSIIKCNGAFYFYSWATLGLLLSVGRFPGCLWLLHLPRN